MARRRSARHVRPTGRVAIAAAFATLAVDVARLRSAGYSGHLELIRLGALVDGLLSQVTRLSTELAEMRRGLHAARTAQSPVDPRLGRFVGQMSELRATVATQQAMLADLTGRMLDLLTLLEAQAAAAIHPAPAPVAPHVDVATPRPDPAMTRVGGHVPQADDALDDESVLRLRLIRERVGDLVPQADDALDDESILSLRLVLESFGR